MSLHDSLNSAGCTWVTEIQVSNAAYGVASRFATSQLILVIKAYAPLDHTFLSAKSSCTSIPVQQAVLDHTDLICVAQLQKSYQMLSEKKNCFLPLRLYRRLLKRTPDIMAMWHVITNLGLYEDFMIPHLHLLYLFSVTSKQSMRKINKINK